MTRGGRLKRLVYEITLALEDPAQGILFDDFDERYREKEFKREADAARQFYRNKSSLEAELSGNPDTEGCEPAWVSDLGRGEGEIKGIVSYDLDGDEDAEDDCELSADETRQRRYRAAVYRVRQLAPQCLATLKLIIKNGKNRKESIWEIVKKALKLARPGSPRAKNTTATLKS